MYIKGKLPTGIGVINKARKVLKKETLLKIYYAFLYPYLTDCIEIWGSTFQCHLDSIFKLPKRDIRLKTFSSWSEHTAELFSSCKSLTFPKLYTYHIQLFMFKFHNGKLPSIFDTLFMRNHQFHSHLTRQANSLHVPVARTQLFQRTVRFEGVTLYNSFYNKFPIESSLTEYKHRLKMYLLYIIRSCNDTWTLSSSRACLFLLPYLSGLFDASIEYHQQTG